MNQHKAALIMPFARSTGRYLLALRSHRVSYPNVWAPFGGYAEPSETPVETARRELTEETWYDGPMLVQPILSRPVPVFLASVEDEFPPVLNWEHLSASWMPYEEAMGLLASFVHLTLK
jgi:8-oxo-dGTP pyrophosphatase MutT (NUDIX family)